MVKLRHLGKLPEDYRYDADTLRALPEESYGHKMRRLRLELGLTQREVATIAGCSLMTISVWERGLRHGATAEAAQLPRRAIDLLQKRLKRKRERNGRD